MEPNKVMKKYREEVYGLKQKDIANKLHISEEAYKKIEQGNVQLKFDTVMMFIDVLSKLKVKDNQKPITIYDFFYQTDFTHAKKLNKNTDKALNNACEYPKHIELALFNDIYDDNNPIYRDLYSYKPYKSFFSNMRNLLDEYKDMYNKKIAIDTQLLEQKTSEEISKIKKTEQYKNEYLTPLKQQLNKINFFFNNFMKDFLKYYCGIDN